MKIGILISSLIHEYMVTHILWLVFYINNNINSILIMIEIVILNFILLHFNILLQLYNLDTDLRVTLTFNNNKIG